MGPVLIRDIQFIEINLRKKVEFAKPFYHETVDKRDAFETFCAAKKMTFAFDDPFARVEFNIQNKEA